MPKRYPVEQRERATRMAQYTAIRFTETLALQGLSASIGSVGDAYDCETSDRRLVA